MQVGHEPVLAGIVAEKLQRRWSPQQIAGWLKLTYPDEPEMQVSHESIYRTLFVQSRGALNANWPRICGPVGCCGDPRVSDCRWPWRSAEILKISRTAGGSRGPSGAGSLGRRPRVRQGHEPGGDPGRTLHPVPDAGCAAQRRPQSRGCRRCAHRGGQGPSDPVGSFADLGPGPRDGSPPTLHHRHRDPGLLLRSQAPWQRGSNENTNGLLRQYLPRRIDFRTLTQSDFDAIAQELNERPRQTLGFKTPSQALAEVVR